MVHILRDRKGGNRQQQHDEAEGHPGSKAGRSRTSLHNGLPYHSKENLVKRVASSHRQLSGTNGDGEAGKPEPLIPLRPSRNGGLARVTIPCQLRIIPWLLKALRIPSVDFP